MEGTASLTTSVRVRLAGIDFSRDAEGSGAARARCTGLGVSEDRGDGELSG